MDNQKVNTNLFYGGMVKDVSLEFLQEGQYPHAVNTVNNSDKGDMTKVSPEPSNIKCVNIPYTYNGNIPFSNEKFLIFSTNNTDSEIGIFEQNICKYTTVVNDSKQTKKLGFRLTNPIVGVIKENSDCTFSAYWNDGKNPARTLNLSKIPYVIKYRKNPTGGCDLEEITSEVDVEKLRLSPLLTIPEIKVEKSKNSGTLKNGSYRVAFAFSEPTFRATDYLYISQPLYLFSQTVENGAISVEINATERTFRYYEIVLISTINQQTTARIIGRYPVEQKTVYIDSMSETDEIVDLQTIPLQSVYYEGGDEMFEARDYLIQTAPRTRPEFNYQPQANKIRAKWVAYSVPENYYRNKGEKIGYTKGEVIVPFIRFVYNTGHRTNSFPLVNREPVSDEKQVINNRDSVALGTRVEKWQLYETATITKTFAPQGTEYPVMEGEFGYYESTETYPNNSEVWGRLACKPQRLFKFPDNCTVPNYQNGRLNILGFKLENVTYPLDENGKPVEGIVGYEVLRADKEGNKTIIAKGLIFNTGEYEIPTSYNNSTKGLYPNFPFNDLRTNPYLSKTLVRGGCDGRGYQPMSVFNNQVFTFHSPETSFAKPILTDVLKIEAEYQGVAIGSFEQCYKHPKHKLIRDFSLLLAGALGIGEGIMAIRGKTTRTYQSPSASNKGTNLDGSSGTQTAGAPAAKSYQTIYDKLRKNIKNIPIIGLLGNTVLDAVELASVLVGAVPGGESSKYTYSETDTAYKNIPSYVTFGTNVVLFSYFFAQGTETALEVIRSLVPYRQHAWQCNMDGLYNAQVCPTRENIYRRIDDYTYLGPNYQDFQNYRINNLQRESSLVLKLNSGLKNPSKEDNSRQTIGTLRQWENPSQSFKTDISAYYASVVRPYKNIYGQLQTVRIVPTDSKIYDINNSSTDVIFGGDTIIEEFTLKRKTKLFKQTQADGEIAPPNGFEFDYREYANIIYPRYWMDTQKYDLTQLFNLANIRLPNDSFYLDRNPNDCRRKIGFSVNNGYMYTSVNGIVRFYVESSYNLPCRKISEDINEKHYDKQYYTDVSTLLRNDVLDYDNHFEIDRSLTLTKQLNLTYSQMHPIDFSIKNNKCYTYEPTKLIYSLPASRENKVDTWRMFLTNNFFMFSSGDGKISSIKNYGRTGVLYFFTKAPVKLHSGQDELQTENGIKVIIGDGGLFSRPPQTFVNSDIDYTECQHGQSVVSTPYGVFFISQNQGKIFKIQESPMDISYPLKWHLANYLPSKLLKRFPDFELTNHPNIGIGTISTYDNTNEIVYFSKIDYEPRKEYASRLSYLKENIFLLDGRIKVLLQNPTYFKSASWTLSYDPKAIGGKGAYISFHDWHPEAFLLGKNHFFTIKDQSIWKHNIYTNSFCNFYGVQKEWSIDVPQFNPNFVTTLESIEWHLECYKQNNEDEFHLLKENFDKAIVFNTEQCSGLLKLNMRDSMKPHHILLYPKYNQSSIDVEVVKKEQKYRLNQFRDIIKNRGEFSLNQNTIFITEPDGYTQNLNLSAIDYAKPQVERKKFRHIKNVIRLIKAKPESKMLLSLVNTKQLNSYR